ncbi:SGNH/GDSL hydrolase family protein [Bacillus tianshenii]|nr:SGNH/GDSL hydrolase family protein [Bacillus tianshenii]
MRKFFNGAIIIIIFLIATTLLYTNINNTNQPSDSSQSSEHSSRNEINTIEKAPEEDIEKKDKQSEEEPKAITEEVREAFIQGLESAVGLFVKDDLEIVAIGDSLTQGVGDSTDSGGYVGIIKNTLNDNENNQKVKVENFGKRGNRTDQLLKRMEKKEIDAAIKEADIVLITIGANDVMKIVKENFTNLNYEDFTKEQEGYKVRLREIFSKVTAANPDAKVYLLGIFNPFDKYFNNIKELDQIMRDWNKISENVTNEYSNVTFIPIADLFHNTEENLLYKEDNFHPNENGYKKMAERVLEYIKPEIAQESESAKEEAAN